MTPEVITALIGLIGVILGVIPTYLFMRQRGNAEVEKIKAETDKTRAEAEKIRNELTSGENLTNSITNPKKLYPSPPQILLPSIPLGIVTITSGPRKGLWVFLTEQVREVIAGRSDIRSGIIVDIETEDIAMGRRHFKINVIPVDSDTGNDRTYKYQISDLMSANGTFLNGKIIRVTTDLHDGDLIQAGGSKFEVRLFIYKL
jgi:hypothetical protein